MRSACVVCETDNLINLNLFDNLGYGAKFTLLNRFLFNGPHRIFFLKMTVKEIIELEEHNSDKIYLSIADLSD